MHSRWNHYCVVSALRKDKSIMCKCEKGYLATLLNSDSPFYPASKIHCALYDAPVMASFRIFQCCNMLFVGKWDRQWKGGFSYFSCFKIPKSQVNFEVSELECIFMETLFISFRNLKLEAALRCLFCLFCCSVDFPHCKHLSEWLQSGAHDCEGGYLWQPGAWWCCGYFFPCYTMMNSLLTSVVQHLVCPLTTTPSAMSTCSQSIYETPTVKHRYTPTAQLAHIRSLNLTHTYRAHPTSKVVL